MVAMVSLRALARQLGVSHVALGKAAHAGTLTAGVVIGASGRVEVIDAAAAVNQWQALHRPRLVADSGGRPALPVAPPAPEARTAATDYHVGRARRELAQAEMAEIELDARRGQFVPLAVVRERLERVFLECRTKLLAVPNRIRQQLPHLSPADIRTIDDLIRDALEALADGRNIP